MHTATRNLWVGLFMLAALALLGWLVLKFGTAPRAFSNTYTVRIDLPTGGGLSDGSDVRANGIVVGHVRGVHPVKNFTAGVEVVADIEVGLDIVAPRDGDGKAMLPKDGSARISGLIVSGFENLIPPRMLADFNTLSQSMTAVAADMHQLLQPRSVEAVDHPGASTRPEFGNLSTIAQRMDALLKRMNELLKPGEGDVAATLANLRKASEDAIEISRTMQEFSNQAVAVAKSANGAFHVATTQLDRVGESLFDNSNRLAKGLDSLNKALALIAEGKGTAGKLLNDPALYESLLLASDRLHAAIIDLQALLRKWEAEGIQLKLK